MCAVGVVRVEFLFWGGPRVEEETAVGILST